MSKKELNEDDKNKNFIQIYRNQVDNIVELAKNEQAYRLFMLLIKEMDGMNALTVSNKALMEILQVSKATICRAVKFLKDNGYIAVMKSGTANVYIVNPEVAWTSYGYQKQYCRFQSNVLLAASENAEYLKNSKAHYRVKAIDDEFIQAVKDNREEHEANIQTIQNSSEMAYEMD